MAERKAGQPHIPGAAGYFVLTSRRDSAGRHRGIRLRQEHAGTGNGGLLPAARGTMRLNGKTLPPRVDQRSKDELRAIQIVFQMGRRGAEPGAVVASYAAAAHSITACAEISPSAG